MPKTEFLLLFIGRIKLAGVRYVIGGSVASHGL